MFVVNLFLFMVPYGYPNVSNCLSSLHIMFRCLYMKGTTENMIERKLGTELEHKTLKLKDYAIFNSNLFSKLKVKNIII